VFFWLISCPGESSETNETARWKKWNPLSFEPFLDTNDNWGALWNPDATNLMSYATFDCARDLTFGQIAVMLDNIPNFATTQSGYTINGPQPFAPISPQPSVLTSVL
jgi:hypothetical protein